MIPIFSGGVEGIGENGIFYGKTVFWRQFYMGMWNELTWGMLGGLLKYKLDEDGFPYIDGGDNAPSAFNANINPGMTLDMGLVRNIWRPNPYDGAFFPGDPDSHFLGIHHATGNMSNDIIPTGTDMFGFKLGQIAAGPWTELGSTFAVPKGGFWGMRFIRNTQTNKVTVIPFFEPVPEEDEEATDYVKLKNRMNAIPTTGGQEFNDLTDLNTMYFYQPWDGVALVLNCYGIMRHA